MHPRLDGHLINIQHWPIKMENKKQSGGRPKTESSTKETANYLPEQDESSIRLMEDRGINSLFWGAYNKKSLEKKKYLKQTQFSILSLT